MILKMGIGMVGVALVLWVFWTWGGAWVQTKSAPRQPMAWCPKHGPIPYDGMIKFLEHEVCAICFHERLRSAEQGKL